jgi:hypothetical protein
MNGWMVLVMVLINAGISTWNAYACGAYYTEAKLIGGFPRFIIWCGLIMAACGFTWCYLLLYSLIGMHVPDFLEIHGKVEPGVFVPLISASMAQQIMALGYAVIILPILGSGLAIWATSVVQAFRERTFGSIARAGWNTFAQANNMYRAAKDAPDVWRAVGGLFKGKGDAKGKIVILAVVVVIMAVMSGIITTWAIAQWSDKKVALDIPESA